MVLLIFFLIRVDSLPPIPDLSQVLFPEPHLWFEPSPKHLELGLYGGQYFGGLCDVAYKDMTFSLYYDDREDWDSIISTHGQTDYVISLPHLYMKPTIGGFYHKQNDEYRFLNPNLSLRTEVPWAFISSTISTELWQINRINYQEYTASADIIFDRIIYMPHFLINGIYSGKKLIPTITGKLHINKIHLSIGSLISKSFPSPMFNIQYLNPTLKIGARLMNGTVVQTLKQKFEPMLPLQYRISIPTESLKTSIVLDCKLDFYNHVIMCSAYYNSWYEKNVPEQGFIISSKKDVEEFKFHIALINNFKSKGMHIKNSLSITYTWLDSTIAFIPRHAVYDTINIGMGPIEITTAVVQYASRNGIIHDLPSMFLISPKFGYHFKRFTLFLKIHNATDEKEEIFDGYFLNGRQYAAGLKFESSF